MPMHCTEPVCRHEWSEARPPAQPRCPRCGGFWVREDACASHEPPVSAAEPLALAAMRAVTPLTFR